MDNKPTIVTRPEVHVLGWSEIDPVNYLNWAESVGTDPMLDESETPVSRMLERISESDTGFEDVAVLPELAGRFCYQSFTAGREHDEYVENILSSGHGSVLEHANISFAIKGVSRSLSHEMVRHRAGVAVSQLSQRFVADKLLKDRSKARFVAPAIIAEAIENEPSLRAHYEKRAMADLDVFDSEWNALNDFVTERMPDLDGTMRKKRVNEAAREFLPNWVETEMFLTINVRALRHILVLRGAEAADMQIRRLMRHMLAAIKDQGDVSVFRDLVDAADGVTTLYPKV